jgi:multiple sugar transport system ATP-binding protein
LKGTLRIAEYLGSETMFYASLADGSDLSVKADGLTSAKQGSDIKFGMPAKACHLFDAAGKTILNGDLSK